MIVEVSMSSIDKTGSADNNKKIPIKNAETTYPAKKPNESLWSYRPKIHKDKFIDAGQLSGLFYTPSNVKKRVFSSADNPKTSDSYHANIGLDFNKDGKITAEDLKNIIEEIKEIPKNAVDKNQMFIFKEDLK